MKSVFERAVDLWSLEIAQRSIETDRKSIRSELDQMGGEELRAALAKVLREKFIPEDAGSTPYSIDDMFDFLKWLNDRLQLPTV